AVRSRRPCDAATAHRRAWSAPSGGHTATGFAPCSRRAMPGTRRTMRTGPRRAATAAAAHRQAMSTRATTVTHSGAGAMWCAASGIGITAPGDACGLGQCAALHHALAAALVMARWNVWSRLLDLPRDAFPLLGAGLF